MINATMVFCLASLAVGCRDAQTFANIPDETPVGSHFEIVAVTRGGCEAARACPSYQISASGAYQFTQPGRFGGSVEQHAGTLSPDDQLVLSQLLTSERLNLLAKSQFTGTCPSHYDGTDYAFDITFGDQETLLHSCKNDLSQDDLAVQLVSFFEILGRAIKD